MEVQIKVTGCNMSKDTLTTVTGVILGALIAANIDWAKATAGDKGEIMKAIGAALVAFHGYLTNKSDTPPAAKG
jgi:hypothetical protein